MGNNEPSATSTTGPTRDRRPILRLRLPVNDSIRNTGLTRLPPPPAEVCYGYQRSLVPLVIRRPAGWPMAGPFYDYDPASTSNMKFRVLRRQGVLLRVGPQLMYSVD